VPRPESIAGRMLAPIVEQPARARFYCAPRHQRRGRRRRATSRRADHRLSRRRGPGGQAAVLGENFSSASISIRTDPRAGGSAISPDYEDARENVRAIGFVTGMDAEQSCGGGR